MNSKIRWLVGSAVVVMLMSSRPGVAQTTAEPLVEGIFHDYTAALDASGPWQIVGPWSAGVNPTSGSVEFQATLSMVRSDNFPRQAHAHHIRMTDGVATPIVNGFRITGTAVIINNGTLAPFSGSPIEFEITGGTALNFTNFTVTFGGGAAGHFGTEPIDGIVTRSVI